MTWQPIKIPLVSIIVPVFRTPIQLLERFLESALGQSLAEVELIAVDDASPDDCPKVLDAAAARDQRMMVIHRTENGRAGMARNDGLQLAKGEYVLFADADDILQPDMCETLYGLALKHDADIVACSWFIKNQEEHLIGKVQLPDAFYDLRNGSHRLKAFRRMNYALWNKLFRREVIAPIRFEQYETNIGEDTLFNVAALSRSRKMVSTAYSGYNYVVHHQSATGRSSKGISYLRTLAQSNDKIKQTIVESDGGTTGAIAAERLILKRFNTGCGWVAENPDPNERASLWRYWRRYFSEHLFPNIESCRFLAALYWLAIHSENPHTAYRLMRVANRVSDPLSYGDRFEKRFKARA